MLGPEYIITLVFVAGTAAWAQDLILLTRQSSRAWERAAGAGGWRGDPTTVSLRTPHELTPGTWTLEVREGMRKHYDNITLANIKSQNNFCINAPGIYCMLGVRCNCCSSPLNTLNPFERKHFSPSFILSWCKRTLQTLVRIFLCNTRSFSFLNSILRRCPFHVT